MASEFCTLKSVFVQRLIATFSASADGLPAAKPIDLRVNHVILTRSKLTAFISAAESAGICAIVRNVCTMQIVPYNVDDVLLCLLAVFGSVPMGMLLRPPPVPLPEAMSPPPYLHFFCDVRDWKSMNLLPLPVSTSRTCEAVAGILFSALPDDVIIRSVVRKSREVALWRGTLTSSTSYPNCLVGVFALLLELSAHSCAVGFSLNSL